MNFSRSIQFLHDYYGILAWGNTHRNLLERLLLLQKKALRIICNTAARSNTNQLFLGNKILKVHDLHSLQLGQFVYSYNNNSLPHAFKNMFPKNQSFHNYPTRRSNEFHLPLLRTLLAQNTFIYTGPRFWNSLDNDIKMLVHLIHLRASLNLLSSNRIVIPTQIDIVILNLIVHGTIFMCTFQMCEIIYALKFSSTKLQILLLICTFLLLL